MTVKQQKMAVLELLSIQTHPVALTELLAQMSNPPSERTLRRWLAELANDGQIQRIGKKRATQYATKPQITQVPPAHHPFSQASAPVLERIKRPLFQRMPVPYNQDWFNSYEPNKSFYLSTVLRNQLHAAGMRSSHHDPAGTYARHIYNRLLIDLSFNSSRLEGNTYSLVDTERLIMEGASAVGKLDEEKVMILNHKEGIRFLVEQAYKLDTSTVTICTIHYLLADGLVESAHCGKVRDHEVRIGGSTYKPYVDAKTIARQLDRICNKAEKILDPFEQSLFLLAHISYLQAFSDVNKRTARLCANIPLVKHNLVPFSCNDIVREDYSSAMIAIYEEQELSPLTDLYAFSYLRTCAAYDATVEAMGVDELRVRYRLVRRRMIRHIVLELLYGQPLTDYIKDQTAAQIPPEHHEAFVEDLTEDLERLGPERIAGLGFSEEDLLLWQKGRKMT